MNAGLLFLLGIPKLLLDGVIAMFMWNWFVPLVFPTAPLLTVGTAIGLMVTLVVIMPYNYLVKEKEEFDNQTYRYWVTVIMSLMLWGIGFIIHLFVH